MGNYHLKALRTIRTGLCNRKRDDPLWSVNEYLVLAFDTKIVYRVYYSVIAALGLRGKMYIVRSGQYVLRVWYYHTPAFAVCTNSLRSTPYTIVHYPDQTPRSKSKAAFSLRYTSFLVWRSMPPSKIASLLYALMPYCLQSQALNVPCYQHVMWRFCPVSPPRKKK